MPQPAERRDLPLLVVTGEKEKVEERYLAVKVHNPGPLDTKLMQELDGSRRKRVPQRARTYWSSMVRHERDNDPFCGHRKTKNCQRPKNSFFGEFQFFIRE